MNCHQIFTCQLIAATAPQDGDQKCEPFRRPSERAVRVSQGIGGASRQETGMNNVWKEQMERR